MKIARRPGALVGYYLGSHAVTVPSQAPRCWGVAVSGRTHTCDGASHLGKTERTFRIRREGIFILKSKFEAFVIRYLDR